MIHYLLYHYDKRMVFIVNSWDGVKHNLRQGFELIAESDRKQALYHIHHNHLYPKLTLPTREQPFTEKEKKTRKRRTPRT